MRAWSTKREAGGPQKKGVVNAARDPQLRHDMWNGPAPFLPYADNHVHYNWRWFTNYGTGKTGDWGVHMMDMKLWR